FMVMCVGMFIALLDIQIVASSLQDIGGGPVPTARALLYQLRSLGLARREGTSDAEFRQPVQCLRAIQAFAAIAFQTCRNSVISLDLTGIIAFDA
ncbi:hypothetical protein EN790_34495, partial [Mesorhizobium sp. M2D.F.Ca.ET.147.01.1.1]